MPSTATSTTAPTNGSTGQLKSDFDNHANRIRKDIAALADSISTAGSALAGDAKTTAGAKATELRKASEQTVRDLQAQLSDLEKQIGGHVRERPMTALAIAAGAGFLIAMLARR